MAVLKCKMCGGELNFEDGMTVAECEYCGSKQTVPTADNEKKMTLFARANRLRAACEFDKAAGVYESIVADFPEEAEAYWGLVLCKYGIEYVDDPVTGKKIPTCHRSSFDSIMDDSDFEMVMENSDAIARRVYRDEAKTIEDIRKGIIEVSSKEEPYDIFICYKETDENGERTIDSVIAQDIYKALTDEGYRVFFARISLEDKLGTAYEPYIFAALNSAKVMLAFGTDYEYYNAVWVKNEWSRFLALIAKGEKKTLIPCYKDIDAYDMPKEFARLQAQDMGKVGAVQDLMRGINKIIPKEEAKQAVDESVVVQSSANMIVAPLLKRVFIYLEDGNWKGADEYAERVLDQDPENAEAYLGKLMAELNVHHRENLQNLKHPFDDRDSFKKAVRFGDRKLKAELNECIICIVERNKNGKYSEACVLQESGEENELEQAVELFKSLTDYKDSADRAEQCSKAYQEKKSEREAREEKERAERAELEKQERVTAQKQFVSAQKRAAQYRGIIAAGYHHTVGLKADGTVVAVGANSTNNKFEKNRKGGQCDVNEWKDMIAVSAGMQHSVALRRDGTVDAVGLNYYKIPTRTWYVINDICNVSSWHNIRAIAAGRFHTVGLQVSGTVVAVGDNKSGQCNVSGWKEIVEIAAGFDLTVGLKSDGTVVAVGDNYYGSCNVYAWKDIVAISAGYDHTVGLKADGTVVAVGYNDKGQCDVTGWKNIVAISAGYHHTVGLKADGTVVVTKYTGDQDLYEGQCDVKSWTDIVAVSAGDDYTVGLKADGTVVAVGDNNRGQCEVTCWKLFKSEEEKENEYDFACRCQASGKPDELKKASEIFKSLNNYKDSPDRAKMCNKPLLVEEKSALQTELSNLKGIFSGKRRKQIEARLAQIESELSKL